MQQNDGQLEYIGDRSKGIRVYKGMSFEEFTSRILEKFDISFNTIKMHYILKFIPKVIQDLEDACDTPKPGGPVDHRQPAETCVSHIMRPILE